MVTRRLSDMATVKEILSRLQVEQVRAASEAAKSGTGQESAVKLARISVERAIRETAKLYTEHGFDPTVSISVTVVDGGGATGIQVKALDEAGKRFKAWLAKQSA